MMNYGGARTETDLFKGIGEYMYKGEDLGKQINAQAKAVDASVALQYRFAAIERNTGLPEGVRSAAKAVREAAKVAQTTTYNQLEATRDKQRKQMAGEGKIDDKQKASFGRELMSEKGGKWSLAIVGSDAAERDAAMGEIEAERLALVNRTEGGYAKMSSDDKGRADMMAYMLAAGDINKMTNGGNTEPTDEQKRRFEAEHQGPDGQPLTFEAAKSKIGVFVDRADVRYRETMQEVWKFNREAGRDWVNKAEKGGTLAGGSLSQIAKERLTAAATGKSLQYIKSLSASGIDVTQGAGAVNKGARFGEAFAEEMTLRGQVREGGSTKENEDLIKRADDLRKEREEISSNWDSATRKRMEGALGATPGFEGAADQLASERKMADRAKKYGVMGGNPNDPANLVKVSRMLGGKLSMEQLKGMEADPEGMAAMLAKSVNVEGMGPEMQGALKKLGSSKLSERNEAIGTLVKAEEEGQRKKSEQAAANDPMVGAIKNAITAAMKTPMAIAPGSTVAITGEVLTREA